MSAEQFEQAKEAFAYKHATPDMSRIEEGFVPSEDNMNALLSDLNSLLEQHKEAILRDELEKFGTYFNEIRCPYVVTSVIDEYLKNVKK